MSNCAKITISVIFMSFLYHPNIHGFPLINNLTTCQRLSKPSKNHHFSCFLPFSSFLTNCAIAITTMIFRDPSFWSSKMCQNHHFSLLFTIFTIPTIIQSLKSVPPCPNYVPKYNYYLKLLLSKTLKNDHFSVTLCI